MHEKDNAEDEGPVLISNNVMEIVVALVLLGGSAIVIYDCVRLGFGWQEGVGPASGYFPFWVASILGISSLVTIAAAIFNIIRQSDSEAFVALRPFGRVLAVLVPSIIYVALIGGVAIGPVDVPGIGIYVASAIFICAFMLVIGREGIIKSLSVAICVPVVLYLMFEKWFLVPLPKGPLEEHLEAFVRQGLSLIGR